MHKYKDFESEKKIYIGKVLEHIHYRRLHPRIYEEISSHMDDMHEDFSENCSDETEVTKKVLNEMGNPYTLGQELKKANASKIFWGKLLKTACILLALPTLYMAWILALHVGTEVENYFYADTAEEAEQWILENRTDGKPIKLLTEIEHEGTVHRIYVPQIQDDEEFSIYHIYSIEVFGIKVKDRFFRSHCSYESNGNYTMASLDQQPIRDELLIYYNTPDYKYIKVEFEPTVYGEGLEEYWSDFIEIPQNGTVDEPQYFVLDCPDGYRWNNYERFDENKEPID